MSSLGALVRIVRRSLQQHALSTIVTVACIALAQGLVLAVFVLQAQSRDAFRGGDLGFDAVLGARGSQLQLVLNAVFHLETSPGNLPWSLYRAIATNPQVASAIPYAVGDNYLGTRIVGTTPELFETFEYRKGRRYALAPGGSVFDAAKREAVVGALAARRTGLAVGSTFKPFHGLVYDADAQHPDEYRVVGVLEPTGTPTDRVIWIPIEGVFRMGGHVLRGGGTTYEPTPDTQIPDEFKEVSAVMLRFRTPQAGMLLEQQINKQGRVATLAWPIARVMDDLFDKLGWMNRVLSLVAFLVVAVAGGTVLASIYNTMNERSREFAILRALGAHRRTVFAAITLEASLIGVGGALAGFGVYALIFIVARQIVRAQTGVVLDPFEFHPVLVLGPLAIVGVSALAGLVPAFKAYATDVASHLVPHS